MYFDTLKLIAELLEEHKETTENAYELASKVYREARDDDAPDPARVAFLSEQKEKAYKRWSDARDAYDDFKDCKFH